MKTIDQCGPAERLARGRDLIRAARAEITQMEQVRADLLEQVERVEGLIAAHHAGLAQLEGAADQLAREVAVGLKPDLHTWEA